MRHKESRFKIVEFENPRTQSVSWRVTGSKRNGERVRENYSEHKDAACRRIELEAEYLTGHSDTSMRSTKLSHEQIQLCEVAVIKLGTEWPQLLDAVDHWLRGGRQQSVAESPQIDEAVEKFKAWLDDKSCTLREQSKHGLKIRVNIFGNSVPNLRINDVTPDTIDNFLAKLNVANVTRDNYRRAVSRFFSWCIERPRRWATANPCREVKVEKEEKAPPAILTVGECEKLMQEAEAFKGGRLVPYVALCLFGGLRPFEASRLTWSQINLADREIRIEANQTKTGRPRVVEIVPTLQNGKTRKGPSTLLEWLERYENRDIYPTNWRRDFDGLKQRIGYAGANRQKKDDTLKPWPGDVLRHTAISHYFRLTGSYGQTAEQFGNSESIIKAHYQGRVSSSDTKKFYAIRPTGKA